MRRGTTVCRSRLRKHAAETLHQIQPEEPRVQMAYTLYGDRRLTVADICRTLRISPATFYRYVALSRRAADAR